MSKHYIIAHAYTRWKEIKRMGRDGISLRLRLFTFLVVFLSAIIMGFLLILVMTGTFNTDRTKSRSIIESELTHLTQDVFNDFDKLSVQGISLSQLLSENLENEWKKNGISVAQLQENPKLLEPLLNSQTEHLVAALETTKCSGVFLILDATVNLSLENADTSRSGIFLKSTEPNILNSMDVNIRYLRGPSSIAKNNDLELLPQWKMEFDISDRSYYQTTLDVAKDNNLPISRLYYWSHRILLTGNSESAMLLCVPLISEDKTVFGICGFEVSSMLFKLAYSPDNSNYSRIFTTLSPVKQDSIEINEGLIAGNYYMTNYIVAEDVQIHSNISDFTSYYTKTETEYSGLHQEMSLYPSDSAFANEKWIMSVLMPTKELKQSISGKNNSLLLSFAFLFLLSLLVAAYITERYIKPVLQALNLLKTKDYSGISKTKILEIDDLFEYLMAQDNVQGTITFSTAPALPTQAPANLNHNQSSFPSPNLSAYEEFIYNINTLSTAEKSVFHLYMEGHSARKICEILCLSINTIKTHNKRIYMKLNVTSLKELMVYVQMMQDTK